MSNTEITITANAESFEISKMKAEDNVEKIAKSILDKINQLTDGEDWRKQQIVLHLVQALYQEQCTNKKISNLLCYLRESDFIVLGDLLESLIGVRMSEAVDGVACYTECRDNFEDDFPF